MEVGVPLARREGTRCCQAVAALRSREGERQVVTDLEWWTCIRCLLLALHVGHVSRPSHNQRTSRIQSSSLDLLLATS